MSRLATLYKAAALHTFNAILLVVAINAVLWVVIHYRHRGEEPWSPHPISQWGKDNILAAYPDRSEAEVLELLSETYDHVNVNFVYDEFGQFREPEFEGRYVNVHAAGFRHSPPQAPWPPDRSNFNIFFFGGSTMFGYGVADEETIASRVQQQLSELVGRRVAAYNFGRGAYFSTNQLMVYYSFLADGIVPDVVIFVDGLNEYAHIGRNMDNTPFLTDMVARQGWGKEPPFSSFLLRTPMGRAAAWLHRKLNPQPPPPDAPATADEVLQTCERWLRNKEMVEALSERFGVKPMFVWQPVTMYKYDYERHHILREYGRKPQIWGEPARLGYPMMERRRPALEARGNFLWLADIQEGRAENFYVDECHYTAPFIVEIASHISRFLLGQGYLDSSEPDGRALPDPRPPVGAPPTEDRTNHCHAVI